MVSQACKHTEPHARTCCRARWCSGRCNWCTPSCRAGPSGRRASWRGTASAPATPPGRSGRAASGVGVRAGAALGGRGALWRAVVARRAACNPPAPGRPGGTSPDCTRCSTPARSCCTTKWGWEHASVRDDELPIPNGKKHIRSMHRAYCLIVAIVDSVGVGGLK